MESKCNKEFRDLLVGLYNWKRNTEVDLERLSCLEDSYRQCQRDNKLKDRHLVHYYKTLYTQMLSDLDTQQRLNWIANKDIGS